MTAVSTSNGDWIIPSEQVRLSAEPVRVGPPPAQGEQREPTITVHRDNGMVRAVDLTCVCGRTYRLWCEQE